MFTAEIVAAARHEEHDHPHLGGDAASNPSDDLSIRSPITATDTSLDDPLAEETAQNAADVPVPDADADF